MRNFLRIAENVDVVPILSALALQPDLWDENTLRTKFPGTPHSEVSDVWLWFNSLDPEALEKAIDDKDVIAYRAWRDLPQVRPLVLDVMRRVGGVRLGRTMITRLPPGKRITPHTDGGAPAEYYTRYAVALQCLPGALFRSGDETVQMKSGEVWWTNNRVEHEVVNNSADDRIVIVLDARVE